MTSKIDYLGLFDDEELILSGRAGKDKKVRKQSFAERTAFLLDLYCDVNFSTLKVDKGTTRWNEFRTLIKVRNRVTHPQKFSDIIITKKEIKTCESGFNQFQDTITKMMDSCVKGLRQYAENLQKYLNDLKKNGC